jgi:ABC-type nitrate/sulfonate/bicarbonate transport system substrate-binding protein
MYSKLACLTILLACAVAKPASAEIINFSTASDSGNTAPLWIAADLGFFEKYGNTVRLVFIQGATISISALLNNDVHMAQFSPMLAIANNIKGIDFTITMSFNQFMDTTSLVEKESPRSNRSRVWQSAAMGVRRTSWAVSCSRGRA